MDACHILLGRPWQFDKKITCNGLTNEKNFTHQSKRFALFPLTPSRVVEDQAQMKIKRDLEKKNLENQRIVLRDNVEAWEKSAPSHEVIQIETNLRKKEVKKIILFEQPSGTLLCKGTLTCTTTLS